MRNVFQNGLRSEKIKTNLNLASILFKYFVPGNMLSPGDGQVSSLGGFPRGLLLMEET